MELTANAKINLTLDILRKREDGYHELQMVMQAVTLADQLTVAPAKGPEGDAVADLRFLPTGNKNLAQVAAANAALNAFSKELLSEHIRTCVTRDIREGKDETVEELLDTLQKLMK